MTCSRKSEICLHYWVWAVDCCMSAHGEVVNIKHSHTHNFPFLWLFPSFSLLYCFSLFQYRESAGLYSFSSLSNGRKQSSGEWEAGEHIRSSKILNILLALLELARLWSNLHLSADGKQVDWPSRQSALTFCAVSPQMLDHLGGKESE